MKKQDAWLQSDGAVSVLVVLLGFLVGTILVALVGKNPLNMYKAILQALSGYNIDNGKMNVRYIGETLNYSVPFILCGLSMGFANRVGLFNIGGEGQYIMGMTVAQIIALLGDALEKGRQEGSIAFDGEAMTLSQVLYSLWLGANLQAKITRSATPLESALAHAKQIIAAPAV